MAARAAIAPGAGAKAPVKAAGRNGRGAVAADRRAEFEDVTLPHMPRLFQFARRLTGSQEQAEDVVQETFLRAWRFFHRFEAGTNARAWLFRILHNVFLNTRKPGRMREVTLHDGDDEDGMQDFLFYKSLVREGGWKDPTDLDPAKFDHLFGDEVKRALERLPDTYRFPILLCDVEGMSYEEIAKVLGIPGGTVRSRLFRGRAILQKELLAYARRAGIVKGASA